MIIVELAYFSTARDPSPDAEFVSPNWFRTQVGDPYPHRPWMAGFPRLRVVADVAASAGAETTVRGTHFWQPVSQCDVRQDPEYRGGVATVLLCRVAGQHGLGRAAPGV
jgi:hypothetical protein